MAKIALGVDVGGTNIVCGAVDAAGRVLRQTKRPTDAAAGYEAVVARIAGMAADIRASLGDGYEIAAVGVGIPGLVDPDKGISRFAGNLKWRDLPVASELERLIGLPVYVDNDVRMYVYGETAAGAGRGCEHVLGITIGTGIAAAIVSGGELYYGRSAMAGELGHVRMADVEDACSCGLTGCLETVASASGMVRQARRALLAGEDSLLGRWFPGDEAGRMTAADLSRAMDEGDALAERIVVRAGVLCGRALAAAAMLLSPDRIIVGGGGALAGERLLAPLREELYRLLLPDIRDGLTVAPAERNDDAGIIGSALCASRRLGIPLSN
ncbi:ROK family protein [Paenibacillaceae bacterium WGS1546]|uniref:ROK family protein n=1 Tax=Cohnella sp. WGS1546 TaxID=3366810 RepID=UPI00372D6F3E